MNADEVIKALRNDSHFGCPVWHEKCTQLNERAADIIESLQSQLAEYREAAEEYGIDAKTMLELAKSQIKTAKQNAELQEELAEYRKLLKPSSEETAFRAIMEAEFLERQEQIKKDLAELAEYRRKEADGRCVVLPCKVGDSLEMETEIMGCVAGKMPFTVTGVSLDLYADWGSVTQERTITIAEAEAALAAQGEHDG